MTPQFDLFGGADPEAPTTKQPPNRLPDGFRYRQDLISTAEEATLVERVRELPFRKFEFHGYLGKRRVVYFGWQYDFTVFLPSKSATSNDSPGARFRSRVDRLQVHGGFRSQAG